MAAEDAVPWSSRIGPVLAGVVAVSDMPPSRQRYVQENPTISFRISRENKEELQAEAERRGMSVSQVVKEAVLDHKAELQAVRDDGYRDGYGDGYRRALGLVATRCERCEDPVVVDLRDNEQARDEFHKRFAWFHEACHVENLQERGVPVDVVPAKEEGPYPTKEMSRSRLAEGADSG